MITFYYLSRDKISPHVCHLSNVYWDDECIPYNFDLSSVGSLISSKIICLKQWIDYLSKVHSFRYFLWKLTLILQILLLHVEVRKENYCHNLLVLTWAFIHHKDIFIELLPQRKKKSQRRQGLTKHGKDMTLCLLVLSMLWCRFREYHLCRANDRHIRKSWQS